MLADSNALAWFENKISERCEVKVRGILGPEPGDCKSIRILNRCLEWTESGLTYEADPRHAEIICSQLEPDRPSYPITTPGMKAAIPENDDAVQRVRATHMTVLGFLTYFFYKLCGKNNEIKQRRQQEKAAVAETNTTTSDDINEIINTIE